MNEQGTRTARMTKKQKQLLISLLQQNKILLFAKPTPSQFATIKQSWQKIADQLNKENGEKKTVYQWKEAWSELKTKTKQKARQFKCSLHGTGGGPKKTKDLNDLEERVMGLVSNVVIEGLKEIEEGGLGKNDKMDEQEPFNNTGYKYTVQEGDVILSLLPDQSDITNLDITSNTLLQENTNQNDKENGKIQRRILRAKRKNKNLAESKNNQLENIIKPLTDSNISLALSIEKLADSIITLSNSILQSTNN